MIKTVNKITSNTTKYQHLFGGYSCVIGLYVIGLKNTGPDFYQYLPCFMLASWKYLLGNMNGNKAMTKYTILQSFPFSQTREIWFFALFCHLPVLVLYILKTRITWEPFSFKVWFIFKVLDYFFLLFRSEYTVFEDFVQFLLILKVADVSNNSLSLKNFSHPHLVVPSLGQETESLIKLLLTSLCTRGDAMVYAIKTCTMKNVIMFNTASWEIPIIQKGYL